jgi:hypothetical protein
MLCLTNSVSGQSYKEDFARINALYSEQQNISMSLQYSLYENYTSTTASDIQKGKVIKSKDAQFYQLSTFESLNTRKYSIQVDNKKHIVNLSKARKLPGSMPAGLDTLLASHKEVAFFDPGNGQKAYRIKTDITQYEQVDIYFNEKSFAIEKVVLFYRKAINLKNVASKDGKQKPRMEIICSNIILNLQSGNSDLSEKKYFRSISKTILLQPQYSGYRLINILN